MPQILDLAFEFDATISIIVMYSSTNFLHINPNDNCYTILRIYFTHLKLHYIYGMKLIFYLFA